MNPAPLKLLAGLLVLCLAAGCGIKARGVPWKQVPESNVPFDRAWSSVVTTVSKYFPDLETNNAQSGYLRTGWKVTQTVWAGPSYGGTIPSKKERVVVKADQRGPLIIQLVVEQQELDQSWLWLNWFGLTKWVSTGSDETLENNILRDLRMAMGVKDESPGASLASSGSAKARPLSQEARKAQLFDPDIAKQLRKLKELLDAKLITEEEFQEKRSQLMKGF
jgi:hypothetical protein